MKTQGLKLSTPNVSVSFYPETIDEKEYIVIQVDKKKTKDKIHVTKQQWSELTVKLFEAAFKAEAEQITNALNQIPE